LQNADIDVKLGQRVIFVDVKDKSVMLDDFTKLVFYIDFYFNRTTISCASPLELLLLFHPSQESDKKTA